MLLCCFCPVSASVHLESSCTGFGNLTFFFGWQHHWFYFYWFSASLLCCSENQLNHSLLRKKPLMFRPVGSIKLPTMYFTCIVLFIALPPDLIMRLEKRSYVSIVLIFSKLSTQNMENRINSHSLNIYWVPCMPETIQLSPGYTEGLFGIHVNN